MVYLYKKAAQNRPGGFLALLCKARMNGILRFVPGDWNETAVVCLPQREPQGKAFAAGDGGAFDRADRVPGSVVFLCG